MLTPRNRARAKEFLDNIFQVVDRPGLTKNVDDPREIAKMRQSRRGLGWAGIKLRSDQVVKLNSEGKAKVITRTTGLVIPESGEITTSLIDLPTHDPKIRVVASRGLLRAVSFSVVGFGTAEIAEMPHDVLDGSMSSIIDPNIRGNFPAIPGDDEIMEAVLESVEADPFAA